MCINRWIENPRLIIAQVLIAEIQHTTKTFIYKILIDNIFLRKYIIIPVFDVQRKCLLVWTRLDIIKKRWSA